MAMRVNRLTRILTLVPLIEGVISTVLFVAQGGFGGGHSKLDFVIVVLGLPSILLNLTLPSSFGLPDILLIVWIPSLINSALFFLFGLVFTKLIGSRY